MKNLLLIVDMQNAYLPEQPWECKNILEIIPRIKLLCDCNKFQDIVFTRFIADNHPKGTWKNYNKKYTDINNSKFLNDIISEFNPYLKKFKTIDKSTYSCYKNDTLKSLIDNSCDIVTVCGVVADCCVLSTVLDIIDTGKPIIYLSDAVGEYKLNSGKAILDIMNNMCLHVTTLTVEEFLQSDF